jgi:hypothetical protein
MTCGCSKNKTNASTTTSIQKPDMSKIRLHYEHPPSQVIHSSHPPLFPSSQEINTIQVIKGREEEVFSKTVASSRDEPETNKVILTSTEESHVSVDYPKKTTKVFKNRYGSNIVISSKKQAKQMILEKSQHLEKELETVPSTEILSLLEHEEIDQPVHNKGARTLKYIVRFR